MEPADIRDLASAHAGEVATHLLGGPNRKRSNRRELRWGRRGSFKLDLRTGKWNDWESGEHGDIADLVIREIGGNQRTAFKWLCRWLGVEAGDIAGPDEKRRKEREAGQARATAKAPWETAAIRVESRAYWDEARPLLCGPAGAYLKARLGAGQEIPHSLIRSAELRFHPAPYSRVLCEAPVVGAVGAMLGRMVNPATGAFVGVQRTFLDRHCRKIERKMLGGSGVVKLAHSRPGPLGLAEGMEDAMQLLACDWPGSMWATMVAGNMKKFPVLEGVAELVIFPDNDPPNRRGIRAGNDAAHECEARWKAAGRNVKIWWPGTAKDPDELLRRNCDASG